jgi:hypothetical protein
MVSAQVSKRVMVRMTSSDRACQRLGAPISLPRWWRGRVRVGGQSSVSNGALGGAGAQTQGLGQGDAGPFGAVLGQ